MTRPLIAAAAFLFTLFAAGPAAAQTLRPSTDENLEWAASVVQLNEVPNQPNLGVKLFGLAGGDPAMNGLHDLYRLLRGPGRRLARLPDRGFRQLSHPFGDANRVNLQIQENTINSEGVIGTRTRRFTCAGSGRTTSGRPR